MSDDKNRMTEDEAELALDAAMDAHTEMFGHCPGISISCGCRQYIGAE
ncbi:hypothetical protein PMI22_05750 [Pseudomonas sp. GM21]|nr:hypothetical protein [Pseudomonas sp. GM21]EJM10598.1 hypothetical protein PMI22_05750 [Pseudomonas sp. GM21]